MRAEGPAEELREEPPVRLTLLHRDSRQPGGGGLVGAAPGPALMEEPGRDLMNDALLRRGSASCASEAAIRAVTSLCLDDVLTGEWDEAVRLADAGLEMCDLHGYQELRWPLWVVRAVIAALRGDDEQAQEFAGKLTDWAGRRGSAAVQLYAQYVQCLLAQARDDFEQAFQCISELAVPATFSENLPLALAACVDFVECAVRTNRPDVARAYVAMLQSVDLTGFSPRARLLTACATALAYPTETGHFERSLSTPGISHLPYDRARVQLAYAERLRRKGSLRTAREHFTEARATFITLRALPLQARGEREFPSTVLNRVGTTATPTDALTPQERTIAELAASGLTNKQIGIRTYLSHRTVGTHLHRVFDKLGISTRAALRDALGNTVADRSSESLIGQR
ncbi:LuxR C-terminal-related transcriptional regulator [Actinoplanes sp. M2I2]|uniref:helix-turn-helix transcriptional regulator n=1 Tax=Actinoplanes sp. M2I2 TaxID=1734444 RepID=UPI002020DC9D|nr:LuxR C-terminal-related transcriptional regulator [Actinoplanes sp. M2I2]